MDGVILERPNSWKERGLCWDTTDPRFFPDRGDSTKDVKIICRRCPVRAECEEYAIVEHMRSGIWGATSERERHKERQVRKKARKADGSEEA